MPQTRTFHGVGRAALGLVVAAAIGLTAGLASTVIARPQAANASSVSGPISSSEMFSRAQYWVDQGYTYSQSSYDTDAAGRSYRDDCSGLVSEAWHLGTSYVTADFNTDNSLWHTIPWDSMQPGDAYVEHDSTRDHIELFYGWVDSSDHSKGVYKYSFNNDGDTVENPFALNNRGADGEVGYTSSSGFHAIRYNNIISNVTAGDFDGDGTSDLTLYRPSTSTWYLRTTTGDAITGTGTTYGATGDIPVPGDYNGDGKPDLALYRPSTSTWYLRTTTGNPITGTGTVYGAAGDIPVTGDYNGDGTTDLALWRPSDGTWYLRTTTGNPITGTGTVYGAAGDIPVPGDYNGDGTTDLALWRPSNTTWWLHTTTGNAIAGTGTIYGTTGDIPTASLAYNNMP